MTIAPHFEDVPTEMWPALDPFYCRRATLVALGESTGVVESFPNPAHRVNVPLRFIEALNCDLFPPKTSGTRAMVYLDQCIISELVKLSRGELSGPLAAAVGVFARALDRSVFETESAICAESIFHQEESSSFANGNTSRGLSMFSGLWKFIILRARGMRLRSSIEIVRNQVLQRSAIREGGMVMRGARLWTLGLSRDPEARNTSTGVMGGAIVAGVHWQPLSPPPGYSADLEGQRASKKFGSFQDELSRTVESLRRDTIEDNERFAWSRRWTDQQADAPSAEAVMRTLLADDFGSIPYIDCKSCLVASLLSEPVRKFKDSDHNDVQFASRALPYSHMMMVDGNLKNRIKTLKLDVRYRTKVFGAGLTDYRDAAAWLAARDDGAPTASA